MSNKSEYQRMRDNILRQARKYKSQGYKVPKAPLTGRQSGVSNPTESHYKFLIDEMKQWEKSMKQSVAMQKREQGKSVARYNDVVLDNFKKNLQTRKYSTGASKVDKWFDSVREKIGNEAMAELIEEAENSGVEVDKYVKYAKEEYAMNYIGDMTEMLYNKGLIDEDAVEDILTDSSYISDEFENFFSDFIEEIITS